MAKAGYLFTTATSYAISTSITGTAPNMTANGTGFGATAGQYVTIQNNNVAANNGTFLITAATATAISYSNAAGATGTATGTLTIGPPVVATVGTSTTLLAVTAPTGFGIDLKKIQISFGGTTLVTPYLVELVNHATLAGGTSVAVTGRQIYGPSILVGFTGTGSYSVEPTSTAVVLDAQLVTPNQNTLIYDYPLGTGIDTDVSNSLAIRITPQVASSNVPTAWPRASMVVERC